MLNVSGSALNAPSSTGISLSAKAETADDSAGFVDIRDTVTGETGTLPAEGIFVAIGHEPATRFAKGSVDMDDDGYILVSGAGTHTSVPGVFAAGDCVDRVYRQASVPQAWDAAPRWTHNPTWPHCTDPTAQLDLSAKSNLITDDDIASPAG